MSFAAVRRHARDRAAARRARGFTLVELLVAIVLVDVGLLAIVQTTAVVVRRRNEARGRAIAVAAAESRVDQLLSTPCAAISGASTSPALAEAWSAQLAGAREASDSVTFGATSAHVVVVRTRVPC